VRIWDPIWLTVFCCGFLIHNVTYIYCAIISRVKCVACVKLLVSVVLLLELSVGVGWGVFPSTCTFLCFNFLFYGAVASRFSAIVKSDIFVLCRDSVSIVAFVSFVKLYYLQFCEVVASFLVFSYG